MFTANPTATPAKSILSEKRGEKSNFRFIGRIALFLTILCHTNPKTKAATNIITKIISAPGMWLQKITTKEPDDGMIEIAIAALKACEPETPDVDRSVDKIETNGEDTNDNI